MENSRTGIDVDADAQRHLPRPIDRRTALRLLGAIPPLALVAACSDLSSESTVQDGVSPSGVLPDLTGPVRDVHLRITASPATVRIAPSVDTDVLRFDAEVLEGDPRAVTPSGSYLGPTLHLREGQRVRVTFENGLAQESIVHWHGLVVPEDQDGQPHYAVGPGERYEYDFVVINRPGTFWYHPHPHHHTGEQVYRGLAGLLIVHGEEPVQLPSGERDVALVLQDRSITFDGQLRYVSNRRDIMAGFVGETLVTNGVIDHELAVDRAPYRVRLLNGANARTQHLRLSTGDELVVVATDGCLLPEARRLPSLVLSPAQRADLWIDFSRFAAGTRITLESAEVFVSSMGGMGGGGMGPGGGQGQRMDGMDGMEMGEGGRLLEHRVASTFVVRDSPSQPGDAPTDLGGIVDIDPSAAVNRDAPKPFVLSTRQGTHWINDRQWEGHIASELETAQFGTIELWEFINRSPMIHPMHLHGEAFRVVSRTWEDDSAREAWDAVEGSVVDDGLIDTVLVWPGQRVTIAVRFDKHRGYFTYHCHILEHEDDGMMRNFRVV